MEGHYGRRRRRRRGRSKAWTRRIVRAIEPRTRRGGIRRTGHEGRGMKREEEEEEVVVDRLREIARLVPGAKRVNHEELVREICGSWP